MRGPTPHTSSLDVPINRVFNFLFYLIYRVHARPVHTDADTSQTQNHFGTISVGSVLLQSSHKISPWRLLVTGAPARAASSPAQHGGISPAATRPHWAFPPGNQPYSQSPASSVYGGGPNQTRSLLITLTVRAQFTRLNLEFRALSLLRSTPDLGASPAPAP
jgi:hypothetical protein